MLTRRRFFALFAAAPVALVVSPAAAKRRPWLHYAATGDARVRGWWAQRFPPAGWGTRREITVETLAKIRDQIYGADSPEERGRA